MNFNVRWDPLIELLSKRGLEKGGAVQKFVDSEVIKCCNPYIPHDTFTLQKSGGLHTVIGSGEVVYNTPYAAAQYYGTADTRGYDALCGGHWFHRAMADHREEILSRAAEKAGGKAK